MENCINILKEKIDDADMVLVGIGEEFGQSEKKFIEDEKYQGILGKVKEENEWMLPYFYAKMAQKEVNKEAYKKLAELLNNKNYFMVSLRTDDIVYEKELGFAEDRIVTPCGGIRKLQCEENCGDKIYDIPPIMEKDIERIWQEECYSEKKIQLSCPECGKGLVFNRMGVLQYCETNYLPQWEKYTKWLQGTLNRKLCIIELGVGLKYPSVIRWPFEKMAFFNKKATIFRVHSKLYQLTEELEDKGYAVAMNPIDFLVNSFE